MDISLERILSLIPKKENGDFKHGALAQFARSIGYKDGHIISDWIAGNSDSYKKRLHEIATVYGVSVEWLKGETEQKEKSPAPLGAELTKESIQMLLDRMSAEDLSALIADAASELAKRNAK